MNKLTEKQRIWIKGNPERSREIYAKLVSVGGIKESIEEDKLNDPKSAYFLFPNNIITHAFMDSFEFELVKGFYTEYKLPIDEKAEAIKRREEADDDIVKVLQSCAHEDFVVCTYSFGLKYFLTKYTVYDFVHLIRKHIEIADTYKFVLINDATKKSTEFFMEDALNQESLKLLHSKETLVLSCLYTVSRTYKSKDKKKFRSSHLFQIHYY